MLLKSQVGLICCFENSQLCSHLPRAYNWAAMLKEENFTLGKQFPFLFVKMGLNTNLPALYPALMSVYLNVPVSGLVHLPL